MFKVKYFIAYEILKEEEDGATTTTEVSWDILTLPYFGVIEGLVLGYLEEVAAVLGVVPECIVVTQLNKLN